MGTPDGDSLEAKIRAIAEEVGGSIERAVENLDLSELAERVEISAERVRELTGLAEQWIRRQTQTSFGQPASADRGQRGGPHPLDLPTEEQGLALSALDSGRWKVDPGTEELVVVAGGPGPSQPIGLVGELRARDWIAPSGELTLVGRDALKRWLARADPS